MKDSKAHPAPRRAATGEIGLLLAPGLLALVPFVVYHSLFGRMFWFGDEFDLIDQMDLLGFWRWIWQVYGENFVPLFKVIWGGGILALGGSYAAMLAVTWLTHALNVVLFGRLMRTCGLSWGAVLFAQIVFGLTPANLETLAWAVQLSAMLSVTFLLLALESFFRTPLRPAPIAWAAASALSFIRGVLTGLLLSVASLWAETKAGLSRRSAYAAASLIPTLVIAFLITLLVPGGNHRHMGGHWGDAAEFGAWFWCLNPSDSLLRIESFGPRTTLLLGLLKAAVVGWVIWRSRGRQRSLFIVLAGFDLAYAALLGIGRYNTGLIFTTSSRYQYASLIANLPAAGIGLTWVWQKLPAPAAVRGFVFSALLAGVALALCRLWPVDLEPFSVWRGTNNRRVLLQEPDHSQEVPGYPGFPLARARELVAKYSLH
jgi:hypothetical protein